MVIRGRLIEEFVQDVRYGARLVAKNYGVTLVAVLTLALGIGANTAKETSPQPHEHGFGQKVLWDQLLRLRRPM